MNNSQKSLLAVYLPFTVLILILDNLYPVSDMVRYLKFTTMFTLFGTVMVVKKNTREQKIMAWAYFFLVLADFFMVLLTTFDTLNIYLESSGGIGFLIAYLFLIAALQKNFQLKRAEIIAAIPIAAVFLGIFFLLEPYLSLLFSIGVFIFQFVLCYMTWTAVCTLFRDYYNLKTARLITIASILILICDMAVVLSIFLPQYPSFLPWSENIIWGSYVPGWTLLAVVIHEDSPKKINN